MAENEKKLRGLDDESLNKIAGGYYYNAGVQGVKNLQHKIVDENGKIVGVFSNKDDALNYAKSKGISVDEVNIKRLAEMEFPYFKDKIEEMTDEEVRNFLEVTKTGNVVFRLKRAFEGDLKAQRNRDD